jgi:hypothetical protein
MSRTIRAKPLWAIAGFAIAVFGGALGCLLLLLRKSAAYYLIIASLLGVIVTMIHTLGLTIEFSQVEMVIMIVMPLVVGVPLIWYSKHARDRRWIS